jgi:hypothetical protein
MSISFKQANAPQVVANKFAIPVGTSTILSWDRFLWDQRDINCGQCKNGFKSTLPKKVQDKIYQVSVICTCVPYYQLQEADGSGVVVYKGRRERWIKGKRQESDIQAEMIREQAGLEALRHKNEVEKTIRNPKSGDPKADLIREQQNKARDQRILVQGRDGHWMKLTPAQAKAFGAVESNPANPVIDLEKEQAQAQPQVPEQPTAAQLGAETGLGSPELAKAKAQGYKGMRPETDEEYLTRMGGEAPMSDEQVGAQIKAAKVAAEQRLAQALAAPEPSPVAGKAPKAPKAVKAKAQTASIPPPPAPAVAQAPAVVPVVAKRGPGRPRTKV